MAVKLIGSAVPNLLSTRVPRLTWFSDSTRNGAGSLGVERQRSRVRVRYQSPVHAHSGTLRPFTLAVRADQQVVCCAGLHPMRSAQILTQTRHLADWDVVIAD